MLGNVPNMALLVLTGSGHWEMGRQAGGELDQLRGEWVRLGEEGGRNSSNRRRRSNNNNNNNSGGGMTYPTPPQGPQATPLGAPKKRAKKRSFESGSEEDKDKDPYPHKAAEPKPKPKPKAKPAPKTPSPPLVRRGHDPYRTPIREHAGCGGHPFGGGGQRLDRQLDGGAGGLENRKAQQPALKDPAPK